MDEVRAAFKAASLRPLLRRFFKHFGYHCATHQIRVILISCVVITSLLYPAIAIYAPSRSLSTLSSSLLSVLPGDSRSPHLRDLDDAWVGHEALHLRHDATAKARCGLESTVRVERLLLTNNRRDENGVLNKDTLRLALDLENDISTRLDSSRDALSCVRSQNGKCLFTSPLSYWEHDYKTLAKDENIIDTINCLNKTSHAVFPVTLPMVLADRAGLEDEEKVDFATSLVLTYYFRETDCNTQTGHSAWLQLVESAMKGKGKVETLPGQPTLHAIQFDADSSFISPISILLYLTYLLVFVHFSGSMRRMNTVHSRFGIAFTGIVEIIVSTITSVSVCAIWGFRVTMVPWGILPIVIVFVGAENMFKLVDEVVSTPITYPVTKRIALGLSEAGASNTLKVVTCNAVLGVLAVFAPGAIQQFCVFAVVVLVAHWFLVHTFFVAVLSIDLQRLELHDFLRQDRTMQPDKMDSFKKSGPPSPLDSKSPKEPVGFFTQVWQGRATRNGSLIMVLAITAVLYLVTSNAVPGDGNPTNTLDKAVALRKVGVQSPAWKIWQTLNPSDDSLLHMRVETPTRVYLGGQSSGEVHERRIETKFSHGTRKILTIFVLPIATTTMLLWALLIYLLKDTETQNTERVQKEPDDHLEGLSRFSTIPRACKADIDRIDATPGGSAIIAVSLEDEVVVWQQDSHSFFDLPTFDLDGGKSCPSSVAIAPSGSFCAVGTRSGTLALWRLEYGQATNRRILHFPGVDSRVVDLAFEDKPASRETRPTMLHRRSLSGDTSATDGYILATYKDGSVIEWNDLYEPRPRLIVEGSGSNTRPVILRLNEREPICLALITVDGIVKLLRRDTQGWQEQHNCVVTSPEDPILKVHAQILTMDLATRIVLVVSTRSGVVSLWDGCSGEYLYQLDETFEDVSRLRLAPVPVKPCPNCSELLPDSFTLTVSNGAIAMVHRITLDNPQRCSCPLLQPAPNNALRSRQASLTTIGVPPIRPRHGKSNSLSNMPVVANFPVSGHGVHSRRGSERDPPRRQDGGFFLVDGGNSADAGDNILNLRSSKIAEVSFEEGAWDTLGHIIYGLRRATELETLQESAENVESVQEREQSEEWTSSFEGLDRPVLECWRFWVFDPTSRDLSVRESTLASLASPPEQTEQTIPSAPSSVYNRRTKFPTSLKFVSEELHDTRTYLKPSAFLRLPFTEVSSLLSLGQSSCLAAFGNTVGLITFTMEDSRPFASKSSYHARSSAVIPPTSSVFKKRA